MQSTKTDTGNIRDRLNAQYNRWASDRSDDNINTLFSTVINFSMRVLTLYNHEDREDVSQNVAITVMEKLDSFTPIDSQAFARWVSTIIKFVQLSRFKEHKLSNVDEEILDVVQHRIDQDIADFDLDFTALPEDIRFYAERVMEGYEPHEIATLMGYSSQRALNNRLAEYRKHGKAKSIQRLTRATQ